ncbi:hypothetical protein GH714_023612 [Hevea brasiliensis]|uniref:PHD-type domain-containing protein n=1 Tax=Hevea brasiliensis TaxID=3981 RepID=A0A6A6LQV1_HEVBR|nr:hypothetical protein GH714_023612 [Hevea brasiliensis]
MDSAGNDESVDGMNPQAECETAAVGEKRPVENGETEELGVRSTKKANCGAGEMQRVAEIVLVLSTMAGMRGGKSPTEAEVNLMAEARAKLVEICQDLAPKDLVARDAIGTVIEDLGLNWKLKDQRLGFRGTRLSIKEKISLSKKKMEESKKFTAPSGTYSSQMSQPNFGAMGDIRGPSNSIRMFSSDKPSNTSIPSGGLPTSATLGHVSAATSTPVAISCSPLKASLCSSKHLAPQAMEDLLTLRAPITFTTLCRMNHTLFALLLNFNANASANQPLLNATTWSLQSHSMSSAKATPESNVLNHNSAKDEGNTDLGLSRAASQAARDQAFRPFIPQSTAANLPGKLLQPKLPEHPTWTPPSREYMNKPLTCQMCKVTVNEVETIVLCDACEKGFHLKCLESVNQKGIPRGGEWHCLRCLALSNGKPLPPKYGRVMRSITPPKGPSNPAGAQPSSEKKNGIVDQKFNQEKLMANGSSGLQSSAGSGTVIGNHSEPASDSKAPNAREMTGNSFTSRMKNVDQAIRAANLPNNSANSLGFVSDSPSIGLSNEGSIQPAKVSESHIQEEGSVSESKLQPPATLPELLVTNLKIPNR